jgi:mRNA interferase MazF
MVAAGSYVPRRGDIVWIDFDPQSGHEQAGRRPALVLSPSSYNRQVRLALFCPVTRQVKGYTWEVPVAGTRHVQGVVLADQVRNLDWQARGADFIEHAPGEVVDEVLERIAALLDYT